MIVVAIIGLLSAIALPNFVRARQTSQQDTCIANLRGIDGAIQEWALENKKNASASVLDTDIEPYMGRGTGGALINADIKCPGGGTYSITDVQSLPACTVPGHQLP